LSYRAECADTIVPKKKKKKKKKKREMESAGSSRSEKFALLYVEVAIDIWSANHNGSIV
jgi:hypothetical protein